MTDREWIQQSVEKNADMLTKVSDAIWEYAELPFQETRSAALLMQRLQERGFTVKSGLAGIPGAAGRWWVSWGNTTPCPA